MATANIPEGKTLESATGHSLCDLCDDDIPIVHCGLCESNMCDRCNRGHSRNKYTKDHDTEKVKVNVSESNQHRNLQFVKCSAHTSTVARLGCSNCDVFFCEMCRCRHQGHNIQYMTDNTEFIDNIGLKLKMKALNIVDDFQAQRRIAEGYRDTCRNGAVFATQLENEIQNKVKAHLKSACKDLKRLEKQQEKLLFNNEYGLVHLIQQMNSHVMSLTGMLEQGNNDQKMDAISRINAFLAKAETISGRIPKSSDMPSVSSILPHMGNSSTLYDSIGRQFYINHSILELRTSLGVPLDYCNLEQLEKLNVPRGQYCISQPKRCTLNEDMCQDIVIYKNLCKTLFTYNYTTGIVQEKRVEYTIEGVLIDIGENGQRLIVNSDASKSKSLLLVDSEFKIIQKDWIIQKDCIPQKECTMISCPDATEIAICCKMQDGSISLLRYKWGERYYSGASNKEFGLKKFKKYVIRVLSTTKIFQINYRAMLASEKAVQFFAWPPENDPVNVTTWDISHVIKGDISSMFHDKYGNTLIGDSQGNVHFLDIDGENKTILSLQDRICRIRPISGGRLIIATTKDVFVYG